jgi:uncharacterized membrane protein
VSREHIHLPVNLSDKAADSITSFAGSWLFLGIHAVWFALWIGLLVEPFPYGLLTMLVSLEAIGLSTLVMISQNRMAVKDRLRDDLEATEISSMFANHDLLLDINKQQLFLLNQQTEILNFIREQKSGKVSK